MKIFFKKVYYPVTVPKAVVFSADVVGNVGANTNSDGLYHKTILFSSIKFLKSTFLLLLAIDSHHQL
jgi:hypothetical protein